MARLRHDNTFKGGLTGILILLLLSGSMFVFSVASRIQYEILVSGMESTVATIVDIDLDVHIRAPDEQEITISYEVDGDVYNRELKTDTKISFEPGRGAHYSVGNKIEIFYDPENPGVIASPRSVVVGYYYMQISFGGVALSL